MNSNYKEFWQKILHSKWANKYVILFTCFTVFVLFFDSNSSYKRWCVKQENRELKKEIKDYEHKIKQDSAAVYLLKNNPEDLEQYAREKYNIKKYNEDVYIIKE